MEPLLEIIYRGLARDAVLDSHIRQQAGGLAEACHDLCGCRVTLERPKGPCRVRLEMRTVPGEELTAEGATADASALEQALDRLFDEGREKLERSQSQARERRMALLTAL